MRHMQQTAPPPKKTAAHAMPDHTSLPSGGAPPNDVNMDDLNDIASALPEESPPQDPNQEVQDDTATNLRLELIRNMFADHVTELKTLDKPVQCQQYPDQTREVITAYLTNTTFTVKVWINFDAAQQVFFEGDRAEACGKLHLPNKKYNELAGIDPAVLKFQHVCFQIGTPFRTLAEMNFDVENSEDDPQLQVSGGLLLQAARVERLQKYLKRCVSLIRDAGLVYGNDGLVLQDLENFATLFRRNRRQSPGRQDDWEQPAYSGGEWAGEEEPRFGLGRWERRS